MRTATANSPISTHADRYGQFSDQHSRWNKKREEYRYAYEEFRGPRMGGFGGRHCR